MSRLWPKGLPITVITDDAYTPQYLTWQSRQHPVVEISKRWRLDEAWWHRRVWREYFKLTTTTGLMVVIYLDWLTGEWYLQMLYD